MILHRDHQEIIAEILESALGSQGITKTRIMYKVQLSFNQLKEYIPYLHARNWLVMNQRKEYIERQRKEQGSWNYTIKLMNLYLHGIEDIKW
jgi:predicted transcriptional regulator